MRKHKTRKRGGSDEFSRALKSKRNTKLRTISKATRSLRSTTKRMPSLNSLLKTKKNIFGARKHEYKLFLLSIKYHSSLSKLDTSPISIKDKKDFFGRYKHLNKEKYAIAFRYNMNTKQFSWWHHNGNKPKYPTEITIHDIKQVTDGDNEHFRDRFRLIGENGTELLLKASSLNIKDLFTKTFKRHLKPKKYS